MEFFRRLWKWASDVESLALLLRPEYKTPWSFWFQTHILAVAIVVATMAPAIAGGLNQVGYYVHKIPDGISATKKGDDLTIAGIAQPFAFQDKDFALKIDTSTSTLGAVTQGISVSRTAIQLVTPQNSQQMLWGGNQDFALTGSGVKAVWGSYQGKLAAGITVVLFVVMCAWKLALSLVVVMLWSLLVVFAHKMAKAQPIRFAQAFRLNMAAMTGPLLLWTILSVGGYGGADLIETIALIVYSSVTLRVAMLQAKSGK